MAFGDTVDIHSELKEEVVRLRYEQFNMHRFHRPWIANSKHKSNKNVPGFNEIAGLCTSSLLTLFYTPHIVIILVLLSSSILFLFSSLVLSLI